jgi:hypothetical protein
MTMYAVTGQILTHNGDWHGSVSVPTFYLDSAVQGITGPRHATEIARGVVNPLGSIAERDIDLAVYAVPGDEPASGAADVVTAVRTAISRVGGDAGEYGGAREMACAMLARFPSVRAAATGAPTQRGLDEAVLNALAVF